MTVHERMKAKTDKSGDCWEWTAYRNTSGYGIISVNGRAMLAHRIVAADHFGMFDQRLCVLHRCDNRGCVRPSHLFLGDRKANRQDQIAKGRDPMRNKTECKNGHPYTEENTLMWQGRRKCRECGRKASLAAYHRKVKG